MGAKNSKQQVHDPTIYDLTICSRWKSKISLGHAISMRRVKFRYIRRNVDRFDETVIRLICQYYSSSNRVINTILHRLDSECWNILSQEQSLDEEIIESRVSLLNTHVLENVCLNYDLSRKFIYTNRKMFNGKTWDALLKNSRVMNRVSQREIEKLRKNTFDDY